MSLNLSSNIMARTSHRSAREAVRDGALARRDDKPVTDCPHDPNDGGAGKFLARYWLLGWQQGR